MERKLTPYWLIKLEGILPRWSFWAVLVLTIAAFNEFARVGLPEAKKVGHHADMAVMLFMFTAILLAHLLPRWLNRTLVSLSLAWLTIFSIVSWWFYGFYRDFLTPSTLKLAVYAEESVMAWEGLPYKFEALFFVLSMVAGVGLLFRLDRHKPTAKTLFLIALIAFSLGSYKQYQVASRAMGGLKHKGQNHITYFFEHFVPEKVVKFTDKNLQQLKSIFPYKQFAGDLNYPLFQDQIKSTTLSNKKNVLLIVLESVRAAETGFNRSNQVSITPNIDAIASDSLIASASYANANQTVRSEVSILCSALDFINGAPYAQLGEPINTACIPAILAEYGYETHWIHGYKKSFFNRENFHPTLGFQKLHDKAVLEQAGYTDQLGWGVSDESVFKYALTTLEQSEKPFFAEVLTLSNHFPYLWDWGIDFPDNLQLPADLKESIEAAYPAYRRGVHYTDYQLGKFWKAFKESPLYDNTLVIITGDHGIWTFPKTLKEDDTFAAKLHKNEVYFRVPIVFHAPDLPVEEIDTEISHADIAPTILDYLGIDYPNAFLGSSILNRGNATYPVYFLASGGFGVRKDNLYCYPIDTSGLCSSYNRKCKNYQLENTGIQCVTEENDLLDKIQPFKLIRHDLINDQMLIRTTQQALNSRFMPGGVEVK